MANKKNIAPSEHEPTLLEKIGEQATHLKDEIIAGKDHLVEAAGEKIEAVKTSIKRYQVRKAKAKAAADTAKKATKKIVKKPAAKAAKKAPAKKKAIARKATPLKKKAVAKKSAPKKKAPAKKSGARLLRKR